MTVHQRPCSPVDCQHPATIPDQRGEKTCQSCGAYVGAYIWHPQRDVEQPRKAVPSDDDGRCHLSLAAEHGGKRFES